MNNEVDDVSVLQFTYSSKLSQHLKKYKKQKLGKIDGDTKD